MADDNNNRRRRRRDDSRDEFEDTVVDIRRVAKVIKGGRRFAFRTVVVVGNKKGQIGVGVGKARAVPDSIRKANEKARSNIMNVALVNNTIPYEVTAVYGGAQVLLKPAAPGTGVIAGGGVRAVLEAAGVRNILSKSQGSANLLNVTMATVEALRQLKSPELMAQMRGVPERQTTPVWARRGMTLDMEPRDEVENVNAEKGAGAEEADE